MDYSMHNTINSPLFDFYNEMDDQIKGGNDSLGFMELLGIQELSNYSLFDIPTPSSPPPVVVQDSIGVATNQGSGGGDRTVDLSPSSEVILNHHQQQQQPATPNSNSSVSSPSSEAVNDEQLQVVKVEDDEEDEDKKKCNKQDLNQLNYSPSKHYNRLKPKKTNQQKRQRDPRFAFMTKSEVDHLEDGYRWRKYGQKAVKNSPYPRSYYRCTNASCSVKKRVERSFNDSSIVVTTYEGQHTHPSPLLPRQSFIGASIDNNIVVRPAQNSISFDLPINMHQHNQIFQQQQQHQQAFANLSYINGGLVQDNNNVHNPQQRFCNQTTNNVGLRFGLVKDHGLLQDVIPSHVLKEY